MNPVRMKRTAIAILLALGMGACALAGCASGQQGAQQQAASSAASTSAPAASARTTSLEGVAVMRDESFGGVYIDITIDDFNRLGFEYGDSVDVEFSNGYKLEGIPYYNGYYTSIGDPLVVGYPGYPHIEVAINFGDPLWDVSGVQAGDTANVTLREAGAFSNIQEAFDITYTDDRADYASDEQFANFRALRGGSMKPGVAYRSASPIDNEHNRAPYVEGLMKQAGVAYILNLSDNKTEANEFVAEDKAQGIDVSRFEELSASGCVALLDLSASYPSESYARTLAGGLVSMTEHDGPYLVHCVEGKDRTGFVCLLLEALCGATYDEMLSDYMETYANYYGITKESDPSKYEAISNQQFADMLRTIAKAGEGADLTAIDYVGPAREYLKMGGMTDGQIDALVDRLVK
jgi:hypothetical protein